MGYSEDPSQCRVDFFKPSGKWYTSESFTWKDYHTKDPKEEFLQCLREQGKAYRLRGLTAVCLEPYCELQFPLMVFLSEEEPPWRQAPKRKEK